MIREVDNKRLELPDRNEITLCEAVTAYAFGKALDSLLRSLNNETSTEEQRTNARRLIERLQSAAYAGRIKFRALKNGDTHVDGHRDVDALYFSQPRGFRWEANEIWSGAPYRRFPEFEPRPPHFMMDWHDVHLDRKEFEAFLGDGGISIQQSADALDKQTTYATGAPGRPTSRHLVVPEAQRILDDGRHPKNLTVFSNELAKWLRTTHPKAAPMTSKTIQDAIRKMWHKRQKPPKIIGSS
jgi:hypothetical protein